MRSCILILAACLACAGETAQAPPLVYVPYDKVPALDPAGAGVMLPYQEFRRLWEAAQRPAEDPAKPPVGAALASYALTGAVDGERAVLQLSGSAVALANGWSSVALPPGLAIAGLRSADDRLVLERTQGSLRLHLPAPGIWTFTAEVAVPAPRDPGGTRRIGLPLPAAGSGTLDLLLPDAGAEVAAEPALAMTCSAGAAGGTRVRATIGGQAGLALTWRAPIAATAGQALVLCEARHALTVGERAVAVRSAMDVRVLRRPVDGFAIRLPEGSQVLAVECPGLRTWDAADGVLRLQLHEAADGAFAIVVRSERLLPPAAQPTRQLAIALPELSGAERQTGSIALLADEGLALTVATQDGLAQIDPRQIDAAGAVAAFRFLAPPPPLGVAAMRLEPDLRAHLHQLVRLGADETRIDVVAELSVRRSGIFALASVLPDGWELVDAGGLEIDDARTVAVADGRRLELALRTRLIGEGRLNLRFRAPPALPREGAMPPLATGILAIEGARLLRGSLAVAAPRSWAVGASAADGLSGADVRSASGSPQLAEPVRGLREDEEVALAWTWLGRVPSLELSAAPRSRELIAHQEELVAIGDGGVRRTITWRGEVRYAAATSLRISLPADLAAGAQIKAPGLAERAVQPGPDGSASVELRFQTPLLGAFTVVLECTQAMPRLEAGRPVRLAVQPIALLGATRRTCMRAIARDGSLTVAASAAGMDALSVADLPPSLQGAGTVAAFRGSDPAALDLAIERHDLVELTDAAVGTHAVRAVLGEDGRLRAVAAVLMENRGRPHLELRLPAGADLLEVAVDGRATRPSRRADGSLMVPLGERGAAAGSRIVRYAYEQPVGSGASIAIDLPQVGGGAGGRAIPVERTVLSLWMPQGAQALRVAGDLRRRDAAERFEAPQDGTGLTVSIPEIGTRLDLVRLGDGGQVRLRLAGAGQLTAAAIGCGLAFAILGVLLRRRARWLAVLGIMAIAATLVAAAAPAAWRAIALGCAGGAATILLLAASALLRRRHAAPAPAQAQP